MNITSITELVETKKKYGVTERKKAELDMLTNQVLDAQHDVEQFQAMVTSLTEKSEKFLGFLSAAENRKAKALSNKNFLEEVIQNVRTLKNNSNVAFDEMVLADEKMKTVAAGIKDVIDKLIYTAEIINKLSTIIIKKKEKNPLISDELIDMVNTISDDANNAVALMLVALNSTYAAEAVCVESETASALEYRQAIQLYEVMRGRVNAAESDGEVDDKAYENCLENLIIQAYEDAREAYDKAYIASNETIRQLNKAQIKLNKAEVKLSSLQAGLAAANAAALAS